jgi:tRNA pseudouridine55 synthase
VINAPGLINGIVLLDKPLGLSSNAALQKTRRMLGASKAGHVGSLDPLATGMLPICLGEATKIAGDILSGRKMYRFTVALGTRTSTGDTEGGVVESSPVPSFDESQLQAVLGQFLGHQTQIPPMYSALKKDGQPLYKLARAGIEVERAARHIEIFSLGRRSGSPGQLGSSDHLDLEVLCSKGTYVRTLAEDIARALGTCGHVQALRRVYVEPFDNAPMETLESIASAIESGGRPLILPADAPLQHMPAVRLDSAATTKILHGQPVIAGECKTAGRVRLYDSRGVFIGIGESDNAGGVRPKRLFNGEP